MAYPANITLPDTVLGDYYPPSTDLNGKIIFGPIQFRDAETLVLSDPTTTLDRVVVTFYKLALPSNKVIFDSDSSSPKVFITKATGAWTFEIRHSDSFFESSGKWNVEVSIYHGGSVSPLTLYTSTIKVTDP